MSAGHRVPGKTKRPQIRMLKRPESIIQHHFAEDTDLGDCAPAMMVVRSSIAAASENIGTLTLA
jgi:hypothetical protein